MDQALVARSFDVPLLGHLIGQDAIRLPAWRRATG